MVRADASSVHLAGCDEPSYGRTPRQPGQLLGLEGGLIGNVTAQLAKPVNVRFRESVSNQCLQLCCPCAGL